MSGIDPDEPMDVDIDSYYDLSPPFAQSNIQQHPASTDKPAAVSVEDKDEAVLSLKWIKPDEPRDMKKLETSLQKMLQTWFNNNKLEVDCSVKRTLNDGRVVIKTEPASAIIELQKLSKQTLKGKDGSSVTITAVSLTLPSTKVDTQKQVQLEQQSNTAAAAEEMHSCSLPVGHFWYVNHMYEEEMKRIEKKNGVKIIAEVKVRCELEQKDGRPDKALDEFTDLIQNSTFESSGSVIPLKSTAPDQWSDALKTIQKKENKLLVTLTSEGMTVCGPRRSQEVIRKFLNVDTQQKNTNASLEEYEREIEDTSLKINLTTKDCFPDAGLIMEESCWKLICTSYNKQVKRIKDKFNVELKESDVGQGKVSVKAFYNKDEGNASMESHALKALLRLYQETATSPMIFSLFSGASGSSGSPINQKNIYPSEGASNEPLLNSQSANRMHNAAAEQRAKNLLQNSMIESSGSVIPLKFIDPDQWREALKIIQTKKNELLVTLTSEEMTVRGPRHSQDLISKILFGDTV